MRLDDKSAEVKAPPEEVVRTVVSVDMSQYGRLSVMVEEALSVAHLLEFNQKILCLFRGIIQEIRAELDDTVIIDSGDGALLIFNKTKHAFHFSEGVHLQANADNSAKSTQNQKHYRIGVCTGRIIVQKVATMSGETLRHNVAGTAIARAVRLQAACRTGEILTCEHTWSALGPKIRTRFDPLEFVRGKAHENVTIGAYRLKIVEPADWDNVSILAGPWRGRFRNDDLQHHVVAVISQRNNNLSAVMTLAYQYKGALTVVQETFSGCLEDKLVTLNGEDYSFIEKGNEEKYVLDRFKLTILRDGSHLAGLNLCGTEDAEVLFEKIVVR